MNAIVAWAPLEQQLLADCGWREGSWLVMGASGVPARPPMDPHSQAEPTADRGEWESGVHIVCVCACERGGGLIDPLSDWRTVKRRPQSDLP